MGNGATAIWSAFGFALFTGIVFVLRRFITQTIDKSVASTFDRRLEHERSKLRIKEAQLDALRSNVLSGRAGRQAQVDKRRIEAVEKLWQATLELRVFKAAVTNLQILNLDNIERALPTNNNLRSVLESMRGEDLTQKIKDHRGEYERPFLSQRTWALFSALGAIYHISYVKMFLVTNQISNSDDLINFANVKEMVKSIVPHHSEYIEHHGFRGIAMLVDEIEDLVLRSLQNTLSGDDIDETDLEKSAKIIRLAHEASAAQAKIHG